MRFTSTLVLAFSALASLVSAQVTTTPSSAAAASTGSTAANGNQNPISYPLGGSLQAGSSITITWNPTTSGPVSLNLRQGKESNLGKVGGIASGILNSGSYVWIIPASLVSGNDYSIEIISGTNSNYSPLFSIASSVSSSSSSSSSPSSSSSSSSPSSSSSTSTPTSAPTPSTASTPSTTSSVPTTAVTAVPSSNSTSTTLHTSSKPTTSPSPTDAAGSLNAGARLASPISLILCIIVGLVYLN